MEPHDLRAILESIRDGRLDVEHGLSRLRAWPVRDLGHSQLDTHRRVRCGQAEVVFGQGKTPQQVLEISRALLDHHDRLLVTRIAPEAALLLASELPHATHHATARCVTVEPEGGLEDEGLVLVISAGTSDEPVAEEAAITARLSGAHVERIRDAGVAGLHRLLAHTERLQRARALVVVAGMEGALPSVVGGVVAAPIIAVPTSIGYGTAMSGFTALFAMLTSCASGIVVVNIDSGFGAAMAAHRILGGASRSAQP